MTAYGILDALLRNLRITYKADKNTIGVSHKYQKELGYRKETNPQIHNQNEVNRSNLKLTDFSPTKKNLGQEKTSVSV